MMVACGGGGVPDLLTLTASATEGCECLIVFRCGEDATYSWSLVGALTCSVVAAGTCQTSCENNEMEPQETPEVHGC